MSQTLAKPEFSRTVSITELSAGELRRHLSATPAEMTALALRFGLVDLNSLAADIVLEAPEPRKFELKVTFTADVVQSCVVTLEPVSSRLNEEFEVVFAPESGETATDNDEIVIDIMAADPPEPLSGDEIDIGEVVAQHLALALDPYPRKSDVDPQLLEPTDTTNDTERRDNPFMVLAEMKKRKA